MTRTRNALLALVAILLSAAYAFAQNRATARLLTTVVDQSNAVLPGATVVVVGLEPATSQASLAPAQTTDNGMATITGLTLGRYRVQFPGFDPGVLKEVRLRAGDNRHIVILAIQKMETSITWDRTRRRAPRIGRAARSARR